MSNVAGTILNTLYTLLIQISYTGILQNSKEPVFLNSLIFICCCCCLVAQSHSTPWDLMDYSPQGSSVHRILQARLLEWVTISFSRGSFQPRNRTGISHNCRQILYHSVTWEDLISPLRPKFVFRMQTTSLISKQWGGGRSITQCVVSGSVMSNSLQPPEL